MDIGFESVAGWLVPALLAALAGALIVCRRIYTGSRTLEAELVRGQHRLRMVLESLPDLFFIQTADGVFLEWYASNPEMLALPPEQFVGRSMREILPADLCELSAQAFQEARAQGAATPFEYALKFHGMERIYEARVFLYGENEFLTVARDITNRRRMEEGLVRSREFLQNILDSLASSIAILDWNGVILSVNAEWTRFASENGGNPQTCGVGASYLEVCHRANGPGSEAAGVVAAAIVDLAAGNRDRCEVEYPCHGNGEDRWFVVRLSRFNHHGQVRIVAAHTDITARKQSEMALASTLRQIQQIKREWEATVDTLPELVCLLDNSGRVVRANRRMLDWGISTFAELPTRPLPDLIFRDARPGATLLWNEAWNRMKAEGIGGFDLDTPVSGRYLKIDLRPVSQELGSTGESLVPYAVATVYDISAQVKAAQLRQQLEEQLRQAQKMEIVGQLAGGVAHDFNNLLVVINGYAHVLMAQLDPASQMWEDARSIFETGERAAALTRQLLTFSRQQVAEPRLLNVGEVVGAMEKILRRLIRENVVLHFNLAAGDWKVRADPRHLEQIVVNLALNSQDAMPEGGTLSISVREMEDGDGQVRFVVLEASDTGTGMPAHVKARIFEPFFTTKEVGKGTGLGLSVVYGIVQGLEGHVEVDSEEGRGTRIQIRIPVADSTEATGESGGLSLAGGGQETILLVEDEEAVRQVAVRILKDLGYQVLESSCGEDALRLAAAHQEEIHLLLADVVMPGMSGITLARTIQSVRPGTRYLLVSGYAGDALNALPGVPERHLVLKPYRPDELARKIREILDSPAEPVPEAAPSRS